MQCEEFYTYIYYDPSRNNEPIYVGKGKENRAWDHLTSKTKKKHPFIHRIRYMSRNNIIPIIGIYAHLDEEFAHLLEMELIQKFGRKDLGKGSLLNLTDGGQGMSGNIRSAETRAKIGKANIGKDRTHSQKSKDKISKSCKGRKDFSATREKKSIARVGSKNPNAKLVENDVIDIYLSELKSHVLSQKYGVSMNCIWGIRTGIYWKSITQYLQKVFINDKYFVSQK